MNKQKEKNRLDKLWKKMRRRFKSFLHTGHSEQLHQFRVEVKKVRSFLTLLEADKKNRGLLKEFKPVKKMFKSAGVIRDAMLHRKQAEEQGIKEQSVYQNKEDEQRREQKKLLGNGRKYLHTMKDVKKRLYKHVHTITGDKMKAFFQNQIDTAYQLLSTYKFTEQLHDGRKALKHLLYNKQAAQKVSGKEPGINFMYVDELQKVLGQWHDNKLSLDVFRQNLNVKQIQSLETNNKQLQNVVTQKATDFLLHINNNK